MYLFFIFASASAKNEWSAKYEFISGIIIEMIQRTDW